MIFFFFNDTATTEIYTLSLHDALPICFEATQALGVAVRQQFGHLGAGAARGVALRHDHGSNFMADHFHKQVRSEGTRLNSSHANISYAVFCLKKKKNTILIIPLINITT